MHLLSHSRHLSKVSRVLVNQSTRLGNTGSVENGMPFSVMLSRGMQGGLYDY